MTPTTGCPGSLWADSFWACCYALTYHPWACYGAAACIFAVICAFALGRVGIALRIIPAATAFSSNSLVALYARIALLMPRRLMWFWFQVCGRDCSSDLPDLSWTSCSAFSDFAAEISWHSRHGWASHPYHSFLFGSVKLWFCQLRPSLALHSTSLFVLLKLSIFN